MSYLEKIVITRMTTYRSNNMRKNLMQEFNIAIARSVNYKKDLINIGNDKFYYSSQYNQRISDYLKSLGVESKEVDKGSLGSASSSARLCTNYFYDDEVCFEKKIYNDVSYTPTRMDAVSDLTFYECKCQEIVYGERELLPMSYLLNASSTLFHEFDIKNIKRKDGSGNYCDFSLRDLGIDLDGQYYEINFNVKQLLCHLIAIANSYSDDKLKTLKYIIFTPSKEIVNHSEALKDLYQRLDQQYQAIIKSRNIINFINKHNIKIEMEYVPVDIIQEHFSE